MNDQVKRPGATISGIWAQPSDAATNEGPAVSHPVRGRKLRLGAKEEGAVRRHPEAPRELPSKPLRAGAMGARGTVAADNQEKVEVSESDIHKALGDFVEFLEKLTRQSHSDRGKGL